MGARSTLLTAFTLVDEEMLEPDPLIDSRDEGLAREIAKLAHSIEQTVNRGASSS